MLEDDSLAASSFIGMSTRLMLLRGLDDNFLDAASQMTWHLQLRHPPPRARTSVDGVMDPAEQGP